MGGKGSGRPKEPKRLAKEALDDVNTDKLFRQLDKWAEGKPVICPYCDKDTGARTADTVALQSAIELLNRKLGKPAQKHEIDITQTIQFTADQIDAIVINHLPQIVEMYLPQIKALLPGGEIIEGEVKEV